MTPIRNTPLLLGLDFYSNVTPFWSGYTVPTERKKLHSSWEFRKAISTADDPSDFMGEGN